MFLKQKSPKILGHFFFSFYYFFQISSRTWGMNWDTIACVFELVDGQKNVLFFSTFFSPKIHFPKVYIFWAYPFISYPQKRSKKIF